MLKFVENHENKMDKLAATCGLNGLAIAIWPFWSEYIIVIAIKR